MTEFFKEGARRLRKEGFVTEAKAVEGLLPIFIKNGVPRVFSELSAGYVAPVELPAEERTSWRMALAFQETLAVVENKKGLSWELAQGINQRIGASLPDGLALHDLDIPSLEDLRGKIPTDELERQKALLRGITAGIRGKYNGAISALLRNDIVILGQVRAANVNDLAKLREMGRTTADFMQFAFKPQPTEQT